MKKALFIFFMILFLLVLPHMKVFLQKPDPTSETFFFLKERLPLRDKIIFDVARTITEEAKKKNVDYRLVLALMKVESDFNPHAVSDFGARGLLQIKPSVAGMVVKDLDIKWHGEKTLHNPEKNVKIGIHLLSILLEEFKDMHLALMAYNMGPNRAKDLLKSKGISESIFSKKVLEEYRRLQILPSTK